MSTPRKIRPADYQAPMTKAEVLSEAKWLLEGGVVPLRCVEALKVPANTIAKYARELGDLDVARAFGALDSERQRLVDPERVLALRRESYHRCKAKRKALA